MTHIARFETRLGHFINRVQVLLKLDKVSSVIKTPCSNHIKEAEDIKTILGNITDDNILN